jgi:hypothetical protein
MGKIVPLYFGTGPDRTLIGHGEIEHTEDGIVVKAMVEDREIVGAIGLDRSMEHYSLGFEPYKLSEDPALRQAYRYGEQIKYLTDNEMPWDIQTVAHAWDTFRKQFIREKSNRWDKVIEAFNDGYYKE